MRIAVFRIIDANFNRSREGLRVCEDISRLALNSPSTTRRLKSIRHRITAAAKKLEAGRGNLLSESRDSESDVGRRLRLKSEPRRSSLADVWSANLERAKESLRVLEELFKLVDAGSSVRFSRLRFELYDIEKRAIKRIESLRHTR